MNARGHLAAFSYPLFNYKNTLHSCLFEKKKNLRPSSLCVPCPCRGVCCLLPLACMLPSWFPYLARSEEIYNRHVWRAFSQQLTHPSHFWWLGLLIDLAPTLCNLDSDLYLSDLYIWLTLRRYCNLHLFFGEQFGADKLSLRILTKFCHIRA